MENVCDVYRRGIISGELRPGIDPRGLAEEGVADMDGLQIQWSLNPNTFDMVGRFRAYQDRLLRSITMAGTGLPPA